jgi:hypothetical protein
MYIFVFFFPWVRRLHTARSRSRYVFIMCLHRHLPVTPLPPPPPPPTTPPRPPPPPPSQTPIRILTSELFSGSCS